MKWVISLFTICGLFASCKSSKAPVDQPTNGEEISFEIIDSGGQSGLQVESIRLISDMQSWAEHWKASTSNRFPAPTVPEIDFEKYQMITAFMGMKNTGGYEIKISSILVRDDSYLVNLTYTSPGKDCMVTEALTSPFAMVKIERQEINQINSNINRQTVDCGN